MSKLKMPSNCINDTDKNVGTAFAIIGVGALAEGDDEHRAAWHESGHAVVARILLRSACCGGATIVSDGL
jgi:hypothetical protein